MTTNNKLKQIVQFFALIMLTVYMVGCTKEEQALKNDLIKFSYSPNIVGEEIEFIYGMGTLNGKIKTMKVEASIAGASGTRIDPNSRRTNLTNGQEILKLVAENSVTDGTKTTTNIVVDTNAVSLRYYYKIPLQAMGKSISFTFTCTSSIGETATFKTPQYYVTNMDLARNISLVDGGVSYVSIDNMKAFTKADVDTKNLSGIIDFVYVYRPLLGASKTFANHSLIALSNPSYINDLAIPATWTKNQTRMDRRLDIRDAQLKGALPNLYIDEPDLKAATFVNAADYCISLNTDNGAFVQTANGKYTAYVYVNSVNSTSKSMVLSIKRLKLN